MNRRILCSCKLEAEDNLLLGSLAACPESPTDLKVYVTVNIPILELSVTEKE